MADIEDRFIRWQGHTLSQLSLALSLLSGLSVGGLGLGVALLQKDTFRPNGIFATLFLIALAALLIAAFSSVGATVTRLLDFRLTAKKVREGELAEPLTMFGSDSNGWGRATWRLFWCTALSLLIAIACMCLSVAHVYLGSLLKAAEL